MFGSLRQAVPTEKSRFVHDLICDPTLTKQSKHATNYRLSQSALSTCIASTVNAATVNAVTLNVPTLAGLFGFRLQKNTTLWLYECRVE